MKTKCNAAKAALSDDCREAAASLVAEGGWAALTVGACETRAKKTRMSFRDFNIHEMRVLVVEAAFAEMLVALDTIKNPSSATRQDIYTVLAKHLEQEREAAALMTHVAALGAAKGGALYDALQQSISALRSNILSHLQSLFQVVENGDLAKEKVWRALGVLRWYHAAAVTRITEEEISRGQLLDLAPSGAVWR